jgi:DNA-binding GntR family transcriptional regulator
MITGIPVRYTVPHKTSERALHHLVDEGLLVAVVGRGFFIKRWWASCP